MDRKMHTVILSGFTALRAIRRERRISGGLGWIPVTPQEQIEAMDSATCLVSFIDLEEFGRMGVLEADEELDVAVAVAARRTPGPPVRARRMSGIGADGLLRIGKGIYTLSPAALLLDLAPSLAFEELLALAEEMCGCWSLPERPLASEEVDTCLDFLDKPSGYYESEPAVDVQELARYHATAAHMRGHRAAETVVRHVVGGSRSPMEAIMNCMYALPHKYGGFGCGPVKANHKIDLDATARLLSNLPYVLADAYLPRLNSILEYNGSYHDETSIRRRDEARTLGLMSMGFDVYRLNSEQLNDIDALESIARMIYRRSQRQFRPRAKNYEQKRTALLIGLRKAVGLSPQSALGKRL